MPTGVAMISVCENNKDCQIDFHLAITQPPMATDVDTQIAIKPLKDIAKKYGHRIHYYNISSQCLDSFKCSGAAYISTTAFVRILLPEIIAKDVNRVLYFDCDIVVNGTLRPLWNTILPQNSPLGAVIDLHSNSSGQRRVVKIPTAIPYFNSGILLMDLDCWRKEKLTDQMIQCAIEKQFPLLDQDVINYILQGRIHQLPFTYNFSSLVYYESELYWMVDWELVDEIHQAKEHPVIIHYMTPNKPWKDEWCPRQEVWEHYFQMSAWKDCPKEPMITRFDRSVIYQPFIDAWWSDARLMRKSLVPFIECFDIAVRLKRKETYMYLATRPLAWMNWALRKVYHVKTR